MPHYRRRKNKPTLIGQAVGTQFRLYTGVGKTLRETAQKMRGKR